MDVPLPGLFPSTNNMIRNSRIFSGSGTLSWLSPKAGLIDCSKPVQATVSFQLKDFCDTGVTDLTTVLRVGFRLSFHAIPNANPNEWIANYVSPVVEEAISDGGPELNLEAYEPHNMPPGKGGKDMYSLAKEINALTFLFQIFQKGAGAVHYIPLSNLHSRISNSGDQELSRYIGSSSLKRRQFIEDRSYIFHLGENDVVYLQAPEVYQAVTQLAQFLLTHGGVTSSDVLFRFFQNAPAIPLAVRDSIQNRRTQFMQFLARHPFAFSPFPSQFYVGVRRNLPYFDYGTFIRKSFPNFQSASARPLSRPVLQSNESFDQPLASPLVESIPSLNTGGAGGAHPLGMTNGFGSRYGAPPMVNGHGQVHHHGGAGATTAAAHHHHAQINAHPNHHHPHHHHHHQLQHHHGSAGTLSSMLTTPTAGGGAGGATVPTVIPPIVGGGIGQQQQQQPHSLVPAQSMPFMAQQPQQQAVTGGHGGGGAAGVALAAAVSAAATVGAGNGIGSGLSAAQQQQKPLFTLFDIKLDDHLQSSVHQNGVSGSAGLRSAAAAAAAGPPSGGSTSLMGSGAAGSIISSSNINGGGVVTPTSVGTGGANNIWTYGPHWDIELLKLSDLTSSFGSSGIGTGGSGGTAAGSTVSPPVVLNNNRKREFVECAVQTDESSFGGNAVGHHNAKQEPQANLCANCAQKI
uniref:Lin-66-like winged helix domain-containing protein n=1 Tax=Globodera rostochiensis TaxID=31243 RepID=A0A914IBW8_GLORO